MADSQDVISKSSQAEGIDMTTMARKIHAHPSPAFGVGVCAVAGGDVAEAYPGSVTGTGANTDTYYVSAED